MYKHVLQICVMYLYGVYDDVHQKKLRSIRLSTVITFVDGIHSNWLWCVVYTRRYQQVSRDVYKQTHNYTPCSKKLKKLCAMRHTATITSEIPVNNLTITETHANVHNAERALCMHEHLWVWQDRVVTTLLMHCLHKIPWMLQHY